MKLVIIEKNIAKEIVVSMVVATVSEQFVSLV